jgi:hypothetical protein
LSFLLDGLGAFSLLEENQKGTSEAHMTWSTELLIAEADRLLSRAEKELQRHRDIQDTSAGARRAEQDVKRLRLYRAVLSSANSAHALMPEYVAARRLPRA